MSRLRLLVAYDGSGFHGFALNEGVATVAGALSEAIGTVLGCPVTLTAAGRTDTGVHAWGQVVSFDVPVDEPDAPLDLEALQRSVNARCGPAIAVRSAERAAPDFDARFSARGAATATPCSTTLFRTRSWPHRRGTSTDHSTCG